MEREALLNCEEGSAEASMRQRAKVSRGSREGRLRRACSAAKREDLEASEGGGDRSVCESPFPF